ncbi:MAG: hypothetical protein ACI8QC_001227 [Planctomycetota bacterium]|jgi:hypothetical protein
MRAHLALIPALFILGACAIPTIDASARYLNFEPSGDLRITEGGATSGNSMSDLGLAETDGTVGADVHLKWGMPHLSFSTQNSSWNGNGILDAEFSSGGVTIGANTPVESNLEFGLHTALLTWDFIPGSPELGIGFGVALLDLQGSFEGVVPMLGLQRVEFDESLPVPLLGARAAVALGPIDVAGHIAALSVDIDGDEATIFDLDIHARYHLLGMSQRGAAHILLGWRQLDLDVDVAGDTEDIDADLTFSGFYAGLQISF